MSRLSSFKKLITWSRNEHASLPWRENRTLYFTLVSEIMLQQTTVSTVKNHFAKFIEKFPDIETLALSSETEMLRAWKGLGYYRRAKNLRKAALDVLEFYEGKIPLSFEDLINIKGIGDYTANALLAIGENKLALALDANLERVLSRLYGVKEMKGPRLHKKLHELFLQKKILPEMDKLGARFVTEALMDLGREVCKAKSAKCDECLLKNICFAGLKNKALKYPVLPHKEKTKEKNYELKLLRLLVYKNGKILAYKKEEGEWLSGQWELPTLMIESEDKKLTQYPALKKMIDLAKLKVFSTSITKYKIKNYIYLCSEKEFSELKNDKRLYRYHDPQQGDLSTASMKALAYLKR